MLTLIFDIVKQVPTEKIADDGEPSITEVEILNGHRYKGFYALKNKNLNMRCKNNIKITSDFIVIYLTKKKK